MVDILSHRNSTCCFILKQLIRSAQLCELWLAVMVLQAIQQRSFPAPPGDAEIKSSASTAPPGSQHLWVFCIKHVSTYCQDSLFWKKCSKTVHLSSWKEKPGQLFPPFTQTFTCWKLNLKRRAFSTCGTSPHDQKLLFFLATWPPGEPTEVETVLFSFTTWKRRQVGSLVCSLPLFTGFNRENPSRLNAS